MKQIGEFLELCDDRSLEQFLQSGPRGYLLHYNALGTLKPRGGTEPGATIHRLARSEPQGSPSSAADARGQAYSVFPIASERDGHASRFLVGCSERCDIVINEASVSREHAVIECRDGQCLIRDSGSTAGSLVNDRPLASGEDCPLVSGARVTLGTVSLQFLAPAEFYNFVLRFLG